MKLFRRIFALTMVIAMVCLFSASAFAASFRDTAYGIEAELLMAGWVYEDYAEAEAALNYGDAAGNRITITIATEYYLSPYAAPNNYYTLVKSAETNHAWDCHLINTPNINTWMRGATFTYQAEYDTVFYGRQSINPTPQYLSYQ